jgi:glyoxylase I family protein
VHGDVHVHSEADRQDPERLYGWCTFTFGMQILGLRPVAEAGDRFDSTRVGLDHVSLGVDSVDALEAAAAKRLAAPLPHDQNTSD